MLLRKNIIHLLQSFITILMVVFSLDFYFEVINFFSNIVSNIYLMLFIFAKKLHYECFFPILNFELLVKEKH